MKHDCLGTPPTIHRTHGTHGTRATRQTRATDLRHFRCADFVLNRTIDRHTIAENHESRLIRATRAIRATRNPHLRCPDGFQSENRTHRIHANRCRMRAILANHESHGTHANVDRLRDPCLVRNGTKTKQAPTVRAQECWGVVLWPRCAAMRNAGDASSRNRNAWGWAAANR